MSYLGNQPATGENNSFRILDDITSYTLTFDGSSGSVVSTADNTITEIGHRFVTGQRVTYTDGGGTEITGLTSGNVYYIIKADQNSFKLASSAANAASGTAESLTAVGAGSAHTLNVAFDSVNTKFKATYNDGTKAQITRAAQLTLSINGVIQQPQDTKTPTNGFGIDLDSTIVFSTPPIASDAFWGNLVANNFPTFDIADNTVDTFTGTGSKSNFALSKSVPNNQNVLVTLDGVVQYPSEGNAIRAYSVQENILTFVSPPSSGVEIQVRHIGFAGPTIGGDTGVSGFYGRTGNVVLNDGDVLRGDGALITNLQAGKFIEDNAGIHTVSSVGINTDTLENNANLTGIGNSFQGLYIANGMMIHDNTLNGNHYIGTAYNGLMAGPVTINGALTIDGNYVVV